MVTVIETTEGFEGLKAEWERIEQNPRVRIFQTYAWCRAAWDICLSQDTSNRLWILKWEQEEKKDLVIFPFYIDGRGCLRFIMDIHSDICDVVCEINGKNRYWVYRDVVSAITDNRFIKSVLFQKMENGSEALGYFSVMLSGCVVSRDNAFCWLNAGKSESFVLTQDQFKQKDRKRLKSMMKKSSSFDFNIMSKTNGDTFPKEDVVRLREFMVGRTRKDTYFLTDEMIDFIQHIYVENMCEIAVLRQMNSVEALSFRLLKDKHINFWIVLYKDPHLTSELSLRYMCEKTKIASYVYDFGVGVYSYKLGTYRPSVDVTFSLRYAKSLWRQIWLLKDANIRLLKDVLKPRFKKDS